MDTFEIILAGSHIGEFANVMAKQYGGVTVTHCEGQWIDDAGQNIKEPSARVLVCAPSDRKECIVLALQVILMASREECAVLIHNNKGEFVSCQS